MPCLIKRSNGTINKVLLSDGKTESQTYKDLVQVAENIPGDSIAYVMESIKPYVGKFITNTEDTSEIALGLYLNLHTDKFKEYFGQWDKEKLPNTNEIGEPLLTERNEIPSFVNSQGRVMTVFDTGAVSRPVSEVYRSVATKRTGKMLSYVKKSVDVLRHRIDSAKKQRDKALNNPDLSFEEKTKQQKYYNSLISKSIEQINVLKEKNSIEYVTLLAETDLEMAKTILESPKTTMSELSIARKAVEAWKNILPILGLKSLADITDPNIRETVMNIKSDALDLDINLTELANKLLLEHSRSTKAAKPLTEKELDPRAGLKDVNWITSVARDITKTGVGLVDYLATLINEANLKIAKEHNRNERKIEHEWDQIKNHSEITKNGFSIFFKEQTNKLGIKTLGLRGPYAQHYYDMLRLQRKKLHMEVEAAGINKEKIRKAYADHNTWINKNTFLFNAVPFIEEDKHTDQDRLKVIDELKSMGFKDREIADMVKRSQDLYNKYLEGSRKFKINLEFDIDNGNVEVPDGTTKEAFIEEETKRWDEEHSPIAYIRQQEKYSLGETRAFKGTYYTLKVPRKQIDGRDSGYYDQEFARIAADEKLYRFYTFFQGFINEQLGYLPEEEIEDLQSNFLPVITQRIAREYGLSNLKETANGIGDWFMKQLTSVDIKKKQKIDPVSGKAVYEFTPRFIDENVPVDERSKDMVTMMKMFSDMALVYKHKLQVQDYVDTVNDIIQNTDKTAIINDSTGEVKTETRSPKNLQNMVESSILNSFYGVRPNEEDLSGKRKFYNAAELFTLGLYKSPQYKKAKVLEGNIKDINNTLEDEDQKLTDQERKKLEMELYRLKQEYAALGGRQFSFTRSADSLIRLTRVTALGFQPFSAFRNLAVGGLNNVIHAIGGQDFTRKELNKSLNIIKESSKKYLSWGTVKSEQAEKLLRFMLDTGTIDGEDSMFREGVIDKKRLFNKIREILPSPFTLMQSTDYLFKAQTAISKALSTKVNTEKGPVSFWEVLDKEVKYNEAEYGAWNAEQNGGMSFEEYYNKQMLQINQLSKKLHGLSGDRTSLMGKDTIWGRLLFVFKTWLPETFATRYEGKRYDPLLERDVEGYYRTLFRAFQDQGLGAFRSLFQAVFSKEAGDLTDLERANLRKMFAEINAIIALSLLYFGLKAIAPDEDDEDRKRYMLVINQLNLLRRDMTYYGDINSFGDLTRQVVPSVTTIENFLTAGKAISYYMAGVENDDGEEMYDSERTLLKITKALPVLNNVNRVIYYQTEMSDVR